MEFFCTTSEVVVIFSLHLLSILSYMAKKNPQSHT